MTTIRFLRKIKYLLIFSISIISCNNATKVRNNSLKSGVIPDQETAIKIAEAIWLPIYGESIYKEKPFHATLKSDSIWIVEGTLHEELGGVVHAEILKKDCSVINVTHYK